MDAPEWFRTADPQNGDFVFLPVFATTMLEGFILSFLLLMISFFAVLFLQMRDRRRGSLPMTPGTGNEF